MAITVSAFMQVRLGAAPLPRNGMMNALTAVAGLKQRALAVLDDARDTQLNEPDAGLRQQMEREIQAWAALVRQLENVSRDLATAVQGIDGISDIEAGLKTLVGL